MHLTVMYRRQHAINVRSSSARLSNSWTLVPNVVVPDTFFVPCAPTWQLSANAHPCSKFVEEHNYFHCVRNFGGMYFLHDVHVFVDNIFFVRGMRRKIPGRSLAPTRSSSISNSFFGSFFFLLIPFTLLALLFSPSRNSNPGS